MLKLEQGVLVEEKRKDGEQGWKRERERQRERARKRERERERARARGHARKPVGGLDLLRSDVRDLRQVVLNGALRRRRRKNAFPDALNVVTMHRFGGRERADDLELHLVLHVRGDGAKKGRERYSNEGR